MTCEDVEPNEPDHRSRPKPPPTSHIESDIRCYTCTFWGNPGTNLRVGYTAWGIQVWCRIHNINVAHFDFLDQNLPVTLKPDTKELRHVGDAQ